MYKVPSKLQGQSTWAMNCQLTTRPQATAG